MSSDNALLNQPFASLQHIVPFPFMVVVDEESSIPTTVFHGRHPDKQAIMQAAADGFEFGPAVASNHVP